MRWTCSGRERELEQVGRALDASRWVTLTGPPGAGKTMLARHVASRTGSTAWFNAVGSASTGAIMSGCLRAVGGEAAPGDTRVGALQRALDGTDTLLVVDGVDIEASGLGQAFQEIVEATTQARLVITAPTMAGMPSERVIRIGPLPLPGTDEPLAGPAVDLFTQRVDTAGGFPVDLAVQGNDVRRLLTATGGLPLLIEQVAVQIALVGVTDVVPTVSLSEAVHASYELLDDEQQRCFRRMAQMTVPVGIEVLAEIVGVDRTRAIELATALARRSLLEVLPEGGFGMLSPIRRHGTFLSANTDDRVLSTQGLVRWADRSAPDGPNSGAADAPWLGELPIMRAAVAAAVADPQTRDFGYDLANRLFSSLYTAMRANEAVEMLESVLASGDGPAEIGSSLARRAGIAASEVRGTYEGLWLLDRADEHAARAAHPDAERATNASIRAEMHLDAGFLRRAETEAQRAVQLSDPGEPAGWQATRTLCDIAVSTGDFVSAREYAQDLMSRTAGPGDRWVRLSARTLLARMAWEQGRVLEAASTARATLEAAQELAEDRIALLCKTLLRQIDNEFIATVVDRESLPWAVRLPVLVQDARGRFLAGDFKRAAGLAADVVALADAACLGRDGVDGRLTLAHALLIQGDVDQAGSTFLSALEQAAPMPLPLRAADGLDGLAVVADRRGLRQAPQLAAAARALRAPRQAVQWGYAGMDRVDSTRPCPRGWIDQGQATEAIVREARALFHELDESEVESALDLLTKSERQIAEQVADGKTTREIAAELFLSPRTVDAHLSHIYRKLDINSRTKLTAIVVELR